MRFVTASIFVVLVFALVLPAQNDTGVGKLPLAELQTLAGSGDPAAQNELGIRYRLGNDVEKDPAKAVPWFLKAAKLGYAKAYFNLGTAYYNGDGVATNDLNYCAWFIFSADAGDERGKEALARTTQELSTAQMNRCESIAATVYLTGELIKQDYAKAVKWYLAAANKGDGSASEKLAYMYDRGLGVSVDKAQVIQWLQRGADLNYAPAAYELAMEYESGKDVAPDPLKARKLYEQACYLAFTPAFSALGRFYADGLGVKVDRDKALAYYMVAASSGDAEAKQKVDELSAKMSPKQIAAAKQSAAKLAGYTRSPVVLLHK
jgi:uncharacterized protein